MKKTLTNKVLSLFMAILMVFGVASTGLIVMAETTAEEINYVSIGDSMANGYGFVGYKQDSNDRNDYDFMTGKGMYGVDAYPDQFEAYLTDKGYKVNHTKLAASAMLAEDLLYLLGGREEFDDGWGGYKDYVGTYTDAELMPYIQNAITEADIITMGIGNAAFGAFLLDRVTSALGVFGASLDEDEKLTLEDGLALLEDESAKKIVLEIYNNLKAELIPTMSEAMPDKDMGVVLDVIAYTVAAYLVNYEALLDRIVELNPDVEIVLVGLLNTTYGMNVTDDNGEVILAFGDVMDDMFGALNAYMAGIPAAKQLVGEYTDAKFYYAEQPEPKFICQEFQALKDANWGAIQDQRLSGEVVRNRNIDAYNGSLRDMIAAAFSNDNWKMKLPAINLADVEAFEDNNPSWIVPDHGFIPNGMGPVDTSADEKKLSVAIYLAIEDAVAASTDTLDIPLTGLITIATDIGSVFTNLDMDVTQPEVTPAAVRKILGTYLTSTNTLQGMCKIYGLFKVGNGMSVHPTPEGHDEIAKAVIAAYENKFTAGDHMDALVKPYLDSAIKYFEDLGLELLGIVENNLKPVAEALEAELEILGGELEAKLAELDAKLAELTEKEEVILADMLAEREAIAAELEALEAELAGIYAEPVSANG
ncbi:MAG: hypothetical protein J6M35_05410, partial [Clostridia bacterium]|nr:hypothetical protein [Clostridia bacterium]